MSAWQTIVFNQQTEYLLYGLYRVTSTLMPIQKMAFSRIIEGIMTEEEQDEKEWEAETTV